MNALFTPLVGALLIAGCTFVQAASSVDLTVKGSITPSACVPSITQGGIVDFGKVAAKDLSLNSTTPLPDANLGLSLICEAPTLFALHGKDNRVGTAYYDHSHLYGLGIANGDPNQKLGNYRFEVFNPVADTEVIPLFSIDRGQLWIANPVGSYFQHTAWLAFGEHLNGVNAPKPVGNVTVDLRIRASIAPLRTLTVTEEIPLDGSVTVDVIYL
ncbi:DUF1120 domain-containing protein [Pseudomonas sp. MPB26]|uniref:DUF1120 domain-containing protein n=1 Tax=Pseudomonas sp. MPB26 TaxID=3388491 RepID=UPI0039846BFC